MHKSYNEMTDREKTMHCIKYIKYWHKRAIIGSMEGNVSYAKTVIYYASIFTKELIKNLENMHRYDLAVRIRKWDPFT